MITLCVYCDATILPTCCQSQYRQLSVQLQESKVYIVITHSCVLKNGFIGSMPGNSGFQQHSAEHVSGCKALMLAAGKHLAKTGFVKGDDILSGTNFIFSTNKKGHFSAEGIFLAPCAARSFVHSTSYFAVQPCNLFSHVILLQ